MGCATFVVGNSHFDDSLEQNLSNSTFEKLCIYVCWFRKKNTAINIDFSLSLSNDSVIHMSTLMDQLTPLSLTFHNDNPMSLFTISNDNPMSFSLV